MEDKQIVNLYWERSEQAIAETEIKYAKYLHKIAKNILGDSEDVKEVLNDTYMKAWQTMPVKRPEHLAPYLGTITRNLSVDRYRHFHSKKRYQSEGVVSFEELSECLCGCETASSEAEYRRLIICLNKFLEKQKEEMRDIFICRYYFMDSIPEIAVYTGYSESKIKSILMRMRKRLAVLLTQEGFL